MLKINIRAFSLFPIRDYVFILGFSAHSRWIFISESPPLSDQVRSPDTNLCSLLCTSDYIASCSDWSRQSDLNRHDITIEGF